MKVKRLHSSVCYSISDVEDVYYSKVYDSSVRTKTEFIRRLNECGPLNKKKLSPEEM